MTLTPDQAISILKQPRNKSQIEAVRAQESELRVFTEELDSDELSNESYWTNWKNTLKARSHKKFDRVFSFARYPLPVVQISDSILSDFFRVFDGKNRNFNIDGDRDLSVLNKWVVDSDLERWIEIKAREVFKNKPCSFVVVDKNDQGKPYLVFIDSERLIDGEFKNKTGDMEYIAFLHSVSYDGTVEVKRYSVYDDATYYVFDKRSDSDNYTPVSSNLNGLGYCPAIAFVSQPTNSKNYFKRRVAFSTALSKFEDWTTFDVFRNYTDYYAPFPVTEAPRKKCPNPDCQNGAIKTEIVEDMRNPDNVTIKYTPCEICKDSDGDLIFPGTHIGINVKADKSQNDGSGVFKMIFPETDKMKYIPEKLDELELEIRHKTVGLNYMASMNEAMNEMQLKGSFESMESVLLRTKEELDRVYKWSVTTVANSIYKDVKIKVDANYGTEFYLVSEDDLQKRFQAAKTAGLPIEELLMIYTQLIETKYKGNPHKVERQKLLLKLDPMPLYDNNQVVSLQEKGLIDSETLSLKINFLNFVNKFELENTPITQFGLNLPIEKRIERIKKEFDAYNKEKMDKIKADEESKPNLEIIDPLIKK